VTRLEVKLARLATLSQAELRQEWVSAYGTRPPPMSPKLLRHGIAYRFQETSLGALSKRTSQVLKAADGMAKLPSASPKPGTQLVRSWNGRTIAVTVTEKGFLFDDRKYRSLSAIAQEVTGAHWSGPRFFGLTANA
jgi:hypothetical protein